MVNKADFTQPLQPTPNSDLNLEAPSAEIDPINSKTKDIAKEVIGSSSKALENKSTLLSTTMATNPESAIAHKTHDLGINTLKIDHNNDESEKFWNPQEDDDFNPDFESSAWDDDIAATEDQQNIDVQEDDALKKSSSIDSEIESDLIFKEEKVSAEKDLEKEFGRISETEKSTQNDLSINAFDIQEIKHNLTEIAADTKEAAKEFGQLVKELVGVVKGENGENIGIFKDVLASELKAFNELKKELKDRALNLNHPNDVAVDDKELAKHLGNLAIVKGDGTLVIPETLRNQFGHFTHAINAHHVPHWNSQTTVNLSNLAPNALHTVQTMTSQDQAQLHSLAKNYLTLSTKMFLLEFLLQQLIDKEKTSHAKHPSIHVKLPDAPPQAENVQVTDKPALEVKDDAKAKKSDRTILPDFTTSAQRKKERARQEKQDEEDKQITRDSIKRKNENYRQDQERLQDDFIKKSDLSLKRKSSERDKKKP